MNISSYPGTDVPGLFFFLSCRNIKFRGFRAEIFRSGGFVQKYWSVTAARYCYVLSSQSNGPLNHKIEGNTMYYMISCKFSEFPFELCRKRAFNRAKKALFWSRAKILPSGYHAQLDSCAGPFLGVVQK